MRRVRAAAGTAVFLVIAPGTVIGLRPWLITGWRTGSTRPLALIVLGAVLTAAGWFEEPSLRRRYGAAYDEYRERVPAWLPRWQLPAR